ncbi:biotin/lipoyl-containing protein [Streptomyces sp. NPDC005236]|uniref:biotin/lipoyl-containing protein n=1 Tax=Streptomyces sp. NPDC005236 TaxID=3157028 RepID=UPI0033A99DDB
MLRDFAFDPLREQGFGHREISGALGKGYSTTTVSRVSRASRVPSFTELARLIALAEEKTGNALSPAQQQDLQVTHLRALEASGSHLPELFMAESACQAYQVECERAQSAEVQAKDELLQAHRLIRQARRGEAAAVSALTRMQQDRDRGASRLGETRRILHKVQEDLARQKSVLRREILNLRRAFGTASAHRQQAEVNAAAAQRDLAQAQERVLREVADREAVAEQLAVVTATLQQVRGERDDLKGAAEKRDTEASILADADAAVRRAERELSHEQLVVGADVSGDAGPESADGGEAEQSDHLLRVALFAPEAELADLITELAQDGDDQAVAFVLSTAATRSGSEVASLIQMLGEAGYWPHKDQLFRHASQQPAEAVVELLRVLERADAPTEMGLLFDAAAHADVAGLLRYLIEVDLRVYAARLLDAVVRRRSAADLADLLRMLDKEGRQQEADGLVKDAATHRTARDILRLLHHFSGLKNADRYIRVAIEAAAQRTPKAVATLAHALVNAGQASVAAQLLGYAAAAPVEAVAETAALLGSDAPDGVELGWLLSPFLEQRTEQLWPLLRYVALRSKAVLSLLLKEIGTSAPPDLLLRTAAQLADFLSPVGLEQAEQAVEVLLAHAARRPPEQVLHLVHRMAAQRPGMADALIRQVTQIPVESAVVIVSELLKESWEADTALLTVVATGPPQLERLLPLARRLHQVGYHTDAIGLLRRAGALASFPAAEVAAVLHLPLPGWMMQALLEGAAERYDDLVADLAVELYRQGLHPYAQMMLSATPPATKQVIPLAQSLWDRNLPQDATWLLGRFTEEASAEELALAFSLAPTPLIHELLLQSVHGPAVRVAWLVDALSRRRLAHLALAVLAEASQGSAPWRHACAAVLDEIGRRRQAQWLVRQSNVPHTAPPPAETAQEAASAFKNLCNAGQVALAEEALLLNLAGWKGIHPHHVLHHLPDEDKERVREMLLTRLPDLSPTERTLLRNAGDNGPFDDPSLTLVILPALGKDVTEALVTRWLKAIGEPVEIDEPLLEVSTDKIDTEIPATTSGRLNQIIIDEDETAKVGAALCSILAATGAQEVVVEDEGLPPVLRDARSEPLADPHEAKTALNTSASPPGAFTIFPVLPALGEIATEATITRWFKSVGDQVTAGEPLLEVATDMSDTEIPATVSGVLTSILAQQDETIEIGALLCGIRPDRGKNPDTPRYPRNVRFEHQEATADTSSATVFATMPALGKDVTEATVTRWLKAVGETVEVDEPLLEVSTDKIDTEVPATASGVISEILVDVDETVEIGASLCSILTRK